MMHDRVRLNRKRLVFFAPDIIDISTRNRAEAFCKQGYKLTVLAFQRGRLQVDYNPPWRHVLFGRTWDGKYARRLIALGAALMRLPRIRDDLRDAEIFYARNIDQLLLALLARRWFNRRAQVVYEVLDIQPPFVRAGLGSRALRLLERMCLRNIRLLVLSSPGFYDNYYRPIQLYRGPWFLLENKLPASVEQLPAVTRYAAPACGGRPWVVGYFGFIRGQRMVDLIVRLAKRLRGRVVFKFGGILTTADRNYFDRAVAEHDNLQYVGEYDNPKDLPEIYDGIDFAWALDLEDPDHNSRWLMPCRFYEAGYFGVPCITGSGFQVGQIVEELGVGWSFMEPYEDALVEFFETVTPEQYSQRKTRLIALPRQRFVGDADAKRLCNELDRVAGTYPLSSTST